MIKKKNNKNDWTDRDSYRESDEGGKKTILSFVEAPGQDPFETNLHPERMISQKRSKYNLKMLPKGKKKYDFHGNPNASFST